MTDHAVVVGVLTVFGVVLNAFVWSRSRGARRDDLRTAWLMGYRHGSDEARDHLRGER
jgi:hypothetical protein